MRPLDQQTILITGATDGLGRALAADLAAGGATVLPHGRDEARGQATLKQIPRPGRHDPVHWYRADLAELAQVRRLAAAVRRDHDRLDALVSNAGIGTTVPGGGAR
jgi:NAD(P)-dependent dehydrogenase (short-subunit alcohol dehydrogenase family)